MLLFNKKKPDVLKQITQASRSTRQEKHRHKAHGVGCSVDHAGLAAPEKGLQPFVHCEEALKISYKNVISSFITMLLELLTALYAIF